MDKLDGCPFCEVEPEVKKSVRYVNDKHEVRCKYHTQWIASSRWNNRVPPKPEMGVLEPISREAIVAIWENRKLNVSSVYELIEVVVQRFGTARPSVDVKLKKLLKELIKLDFKDPNGRLGNFSPSTEMALRHEVSRLAQLAQAIDACIKAYNEARPLVVSNVEIIDVLNDCINQMRRFSMSNNNEIAIKNAEHVLNKLKGDYERTR